MGKSIEDFTYNNEEIAKIMYSAMNSTEFLGISVSLPLSSRLVQGYFLKQYSWKFSIQEKQINSLVKNICTPEGNLGKICIL